MADREVGFTLKPTVKHKPAVAGLKKVSGGLSAIGKTAKDSDQRLTRMTEAGKKRFDLLGRAAQKTGRIMEVGFRNAQRAARGLWNTLGGLRNRLTSITGLLGAAGLAYGGAQIIGLGARRAATRAAIERLAGKVSPDAFGKIEAARGKFLAAGIQDMGAVIPGLHALANIREGTAFRGVNYLSKEQAAAVRAKQLPRLLKLIPQMAKMAIANFRVIDDQMLGKLAAGLGDRGEGLPAFAEAAGMNVERAKELVKLNLGGIAAFARGLKGTTLEGVDIGELAFRDIPGLSLLKILAREEGLSPDVLGGAVAKAGGLDKLQRIKAGVKDAFAAFGERLLKNFGGTLVSLEKLVRTGKLKQHMLDLADGIADVAQKIGWLVTKIGGAIDKIQKLQGIIGGGEEATGAYGLIRGWGNFMIRGHGLVGRGIGGLKWGGEKLREFLFGDPGKEGPSGIDPGGSREHGIPGGSPWSRAPGLPDGKLVVNVHIGNEQLHHYVTQVIAEDMDLAATAAGFPT
jgi:hypothetical protein